MPAADPQAEAAVLDELSSRYAAPGRHYHSLTHLEHVIADCLTILTDGADDLAVAARPQRREILAAAFFHDAVYEVPTDGSDPRNEGTQRTSPPLGWRRWAGRAMPSTPCAR
ncbi:MAG: hypothetical protein R2705_11355 [Ilumatobacteraceae bacterium]